MSQCVGIGCLKSWRMAYKVSILDVTPLERLFVLIALWRLTEQQRFKVQRSNIAPPHYLVGQPHEFISDDMRPTGLMFVCLATFLLPAVSICN